MAPCREHLDHLAGQVPSLRSAQHEGLGSCQSFSGHALSQGLYVCVCFFPISQYTPVLFKNVLISLRGGCASGAPLWFS